MKKQDWRPLLWPDDVPWIVGPIDPKYIDWGI